MSISRRELFEVWCQESVTKNKNSAVLACVLSKLNISESDEDASYGSTKKLVKNFTSKLTLKWKECRRTSKVFESRHGQWLDESIVFIIQETSAQSTVVRKGRPSKKFSEVSRQSKRQKVQPLIGTYTKEELSFAASTSLRMSGRRDAAKIVETVTEKSPKRATRIKKTISSPNLAPIKYTPEEALALFIDGHMTKHSYILMQSGAKARNANIYPPYYVIKKAKKDCYPDQECISISDVSAEVKLQALVDHTAARIVMVQKDVLEQRLPELSEGVTLIYKWGCDGSAGHSTYKQKFTGDGDGARTDSYLFAECLVPLQLHTKENKIVWNNHRPSSTRFCRPIKLLFQKETTDLSKKEIETVENQIKDILPTKVIINNQEISINHCFKLTMIDGKMFGVITESSTQTCGICGATPKIMNNLDEIWKRTPDASKMDFGVSTLHAWIRCFEAILHISYRLTTQKWQIRDNEDKKRVNERKQYIREKLRTEMGLLVDIPKPGFGTTNDGNTARRFFQQPSLVSSITGIDEDLIKRFSVILKTMSCGYAVNADAFNDYAKQTAKKYVDLYSWYYMPSSLHKILIHGADIIKTSILPIGMLSEEALESRNKDFKRYREFNTRKFSRKETMTDLFNYVLFSSDPFISSLSKSSSTIYSYKETLHSDVIQLLSDPALPMTSRTFSDDSDNSDDSDSEIN